MAIFKNTYTKKIPDNAIPCTVEQRQAVKWKGRKGKWVYGFVLPNGKCSVESNVWSFKLPGDKTTYPGSPDKQATEKMYAEALLRQKEQTNEKPIRETQKTVRQLIDEWKASLTNKDMTEKHVYQVVKCVQRITDHLQASNINDINPETVEAAVKSFGVNDQTESHYIAAIKSFARWLHLSKRTNENKLAWLKKKTVFTNPKVVRRILEPEDFQKLIAAAMQNKKKIFGLTGKQRAVLYKFAASTGLRRGEIVSLTTESIDWSANPVTVQVEARHAKNRRLARLPIPAWLVTDLKSIVDWKRKVPLFPGNGHFKYKAADMLKKDLKAAGIPYRAQDGRTYDFHSFRSQYITDLLNAGVPLPTVKELARHSDPKLTAHYCKETPKTLSAAVDLLKR